MAEPDPDLVHDRASFLAFVAALAEDSRISEENEKKWPSSPYGPAHGGWQNTTIESFLDAAVRWAIASDMGTSNLQRIPCDLSWQAFANFLYCGKIYE